MKQIYKIILGSLFLLPISCADYLDVVPDNVATIEYAFRMRSAAEQYLSTCYRYMPSHANVSGNPALFGADEWWFSEQAYADSWQPWNIAKGQQNKNNPRVDFWRGANGGKDLFEAIRQCNIFLENINIVPDMTIEEKEQWAAEVKFLKAYYHFYLLRAYGPIPIIRENLPISASGAEVRVYREPVDDVFEYIFTLIDEALEFLPDQVMDQATEMGRITLPIALGMKAYIAVYAASPLFNGNTDYRNFKNHEGIHFISQDYSEEKWQRAVNACKEAIDLAHLTGYSLYEFQGSLFATGVSEETTLHLTIRGIVTERWNPEIIWANTNSLATNLQTWGHPLSLSPNASGSSGSGATGSFGVSKNITEHFYSKNGVPINEDRFWNYSNRFALRVATNDERYRLRPGYTTAQYNYDREPRYYATFGFDGGTWYGHARYNDEDPWFFEGKRGQNGGKSQAGWHSVAGYYAKKLDYYTNSHTSSSVYSTTSYAWPILRLGNLYLLYAEALNELSGPSSDVFEYIDAIRERAGLMGVEESWSQYSIYPTKPETKEGLREIIRQERTIELALEGQRFWDVRRWKSAIYELNQNITGWDVDQTTALDYYRERVLYLQKFEFKDYFWPIREQDIIVNRNLIQNPGW